MNTVIHVAGILSRSPEAEGSAGADDMDTDGQHTGPTRLVSARLSLASEHICQL